MRKTAYFVDRWLLPSVPKREYTEPGLKRKALQNLEALMHSLISRASRPCKTLVPFFYRRRRKDRTKQASCVAGQAPPRVPVLHFCTAFFSALRRPGRAKGFLGPTTECNCSFRKRG
ncbi:hypothetical protein CONLIGDRAFT_54187 [Coniochaeta ligniaria NRRL 30616]|uniref:Uncharacterized protein n=1 Tax=Coniochaeta ligniaria NRRL 30616 TaxID=1408157 RepID=A0A1J7JPN3_9PEZI|nr:hypothetical protein CONLIGDRAFT_54187 [Coniochaeta ligniaria NRRL 30616]